MARFIPIEKMKSLREAAKNGDDRAKKIISMQLDGTDDFGPLMDEYFAPAPVAEEVPATESNDKLEEFLKFNGVTKDSPDYQSYVDDFNKENGIGTQEQENSNECEDLIKKLISEEIDAIDSYSKAITQIMSCEDLEENKKRKIISRLEEIKGDEIEHRRELLELKENVKNKKNDETI